MQMVTCHPLHPAQETSKKIENFVETSQLSLREFHFKIIVCTQIFLPFRLRGMTFSRQLSYIIQYVVVYSKDAAMLADLTPIVLYHFVTYCHIVACYFFDILSVKRCHRFPSNQSINWTHGDQYERSDPDFFVLWFYSRHHMPSW